jgi:hypothetical protein
VKSPTRDVSIPPTAAPPEGSRELALRQRNTMKLMGGTQAFAREENFHRSEKLRKVQQHEPRLQKTRSKYKRQDRQMSWNATALTTYR